jgi:hypothetical protein
MPCQQFSLNNPPLNAISGPYNSLEECNQGCSGCPSGQECKAFVDGQVACVKINGEWQRYQTLSPQPLPCGCPNGFAEELLEETGPPPWDDSGTIQAYKLIRCTGEASADYATCCVPGSNLGDCAAYQQLLVAATNSLDHPVNGGAICV